MIKDFASGKPQPGAESPRIKEELSSRPVGKCFGYLENGTWYWCADHVVADMRAQGYTVLPVVSVAGKP